jgi:hypothetical protein
MRNAPAPGIGPPVIRPCLVSRTRDSLQTSRSGTRTAGHDTATARAETPARAVKRSQVPAHYPSARLRRNSAGWTDIRSR